VTHELAESLRVPSFLAESYLPRPRASDVRERERRAREAARELTRRGTPIRFVRSIFVPEDEICFFVFDAMSASAVEAACARAALRFERVVEAIESRPGRSQAREKIRNAAPQGERRGT
jgi:hypothetical protein